VSKTLRDAVTEEVTETKTVKRELRASVCEVCGFVHQMRDRISSMQVGRMSGIFSRCADDGDGNSLGNQFSAVVCSFTCAELMLNGRWRMLERYRPYVDADAVLARVEVRITPYVLTEAELIEEWEARDRDPPKLFHSHMTPK